MKRLIASLAALACVVALAIMAGQGGAGLQRHMLAESVSVTAYPVQHLKVGEPGLTRFGPLEYIGGFEVLGRHPNFGGISAIRVEADGSRFLAATDTGDWVQGRIIYAGGKPTGLGDVVIAPVLTADGRRAKDVGLWDIESIAKDGDTVFVGIERTHTVLAFDWRQGGLAVRGTSVKLPGFVQNWWGNRGIEAMGFAPASGPLAGKVVALSERSGATDAPNEGFVMDRDGGAPFRFSVQRADGFDTTALDFLPNGDLLILERVFSPLRGVAMRLKRVKAAGIRPEAVLTPDILLTLDNSHHIDNMEGLSVHRNAAGETILTLVSDDNFSLAQRTLFLQFRWMGE